MRRRSAWGVLLAIVAVLPLLWLVAPAGLAAPLAQGCPARPNVGANVLPSGSVSIVPTTLGRLEVTISAQVTPGVPNNSLHEIRFGSSTNALVDVPGGQSGVPGNFTLPLPAGTRQTTIFVSQANATLAATANLIVVDDCGDWQTFVGGGVPAFRPPTIRGFTPASGASGASVQVSGINLSGASALEFNGTRATFTVDSATQITATVPAGATNGPLRVTTLGGTATSAASFSVLSITSFTPASGPEGASVTITGTTLTGATAVRFNGVAAAFTVDTGTQITATVPVGATTGTISLTTPGGSATSAASFAVSPGVTGFTPPSGGVGTTVTLTGTTFTGATVVRFNGVSAAFTIDSATQITATLPYGAATGPLSVTTAAGTGASATSFTTNTVFWLPNASGDWDTPANWSTNAVPGSTQDVYASVPASVTITKTAGSGSINTLYSDEGITLAGGSLAIANASVVNGAYTQSGGTLSGAGTLALQGGGTWSGGTMSGAGTTNLPASAALAINGGGTKTLSGRPLTSAGVVTWSGTGALSLDGGASLTNGTGATFTIQNDQSILAGAGGGIFTNAGTLTKSVAVGTTTVAVTFTNSSALTWPQGTLALAGGGTSSAAVNVSAGATVSVTAGTYMLQVGGASSGIFHTATGAILDFTGGTYALNAGASLTGAGTGVSRVAGATLTVNAPVAAQNLALQSGMLNGSGTLTAAGSFAWSGGTMSGSGTTTVNGGLSITGNVSLDTRALNAGGASSISAGTLTWSNGTTFTVLAGGSFNVPSGTNFAQGSGATSTLVNNGQINLFPVSISPPCVGLAGNYTQGATGVYQRDMASGGGCPSLIVSGTATLAGTLRIVSNGFTPPDNRTYQVLAFGSRSGMFTTYNDTTGYWPGPPTYNANSVTILSSCPLVQPECFN